MHSGLYSIALYLFCVFNIAEFQSSQCADLCGPNPCDVENGGCQHFCSPSGDGDNVTCSCSDGYKLEENGYSCALIRDIPLVNYYLEHCLPGIRDEEEEDAECSQARDDLDGESDVRRAKDRTCNDPPPKGNKPRPIAGPNQGYNPYQSGSVDETWNEAYLICQDSETRIFYFDQTSGKCASVCANYDTADTAETFNSYDSLEICQLLCEDPCMQPLHYGNCTDGSKGVVLTRAYYNKDTQTCKSFGYSGCGGNKNNFESIHDCMMVCPVTLLLEVNGTTITIDSTKISPSRVNVNKFGVELKINVKRSVNGDGDDEDDTAQSTGLPWNPARLSFEQGQFAADTPLYNAPIQTTVNRPNEQDDVRIPPTSPNPGRPPVSDDIPVRMTDNQIVFVVHQLKITEESDGETDDDRKITEICAATDAEHPDLRESLFEADESTTVAETKAALQDLQRGLEDEIAQGEALEDGDANINGSSSSGGHSSSKMLPWVTVFRDLDDKTITVHIRIWCLESVFKLMPNYQTFRRLCQLVKSGIEKHWSRDVVYKGSTWQMVVKVVESPILSKKFVIKYYSSPAPLANELEVSSDVLIYRAYDINDRDAQFQYQAAWVFGEAALNLRAAPYRRGGTRISRAAVPAQETDLMTAYRAHVTPDAASRIKVSQPHALAVVNSAQGFPFKLLPCLFCDYCTSDKDCKFWQYCYGLNNPLIPNVCKPKKSFGSWCFTDRECISHRCHGFRCVECEKDSHCKSSEYCAYKNLPLIAANKCRSKKNIGGVCGRDAMCKSGHCDGFRCGECTHNSDCPWGHYCRYNNLPFVTNRCRSKKKNGSWCVKDSQCKSGYCHGFRCGECEKDSHCPSGKYCKYKNIIFKTNKCVNKKCKGWCIRGSQCKTGKCRLFRCKKC